MKLIFSILIIFISLTVHPQSRRFTLDKSNLVTVQSNNINQPTKQSTMKLFIAIEEGRNLRSRFITSLEIIARNEIEARKIIREYNRYVFDNKLKVKELNRPIICEVTMTGAFEHHKNSTRGFYNPTTEVQ